MEWWVAVLGGAATGLLFKATVWAVEDIQIRVKQREGN